MKMRTWVGGGLVLLLAGGWLSRAEAEAPNAFQEASSHYEAIRLSLVADDMSGVSEHARAIEIRMQTLAKEFSVQRAGVAEEKSEEGRALVPEVAIAAGRLASAVDLDQAREALFELSKPMGRYRKLAGIEGTAVFFCPMVKKAWIQPEGEIGNPYLGQKMSTCGQVIAD